MPSAEDDGMRLGVINGKALQFIVPPTEGGMEIKMEGLNETNCYTEGNAGNRCLFNP